MEIAIFAKQRKTKEGRSFVVYLSSLKKKTGEQIPCSVKFNQSCTAPDPAKCPMNIIVDHEHCNISKRHYLNEATGEIVDAHTLWVSQYAGGSEYVDHSMDEFED